MRVLKGFLAFVSVSVAGCVTFDPDRGQDKFEPIERVLAQAQSEERVQDERTSPPPKPLPKPDFKVFDDVLSYEKIVVETSSGAKIQANFRNMPLPEFINETLGNRLGLSYILDPALSDSEDLVTLSINEELSPESFLRAIRSVLAEYGIVLRQEGTLLMVDVDSNAARVSDRPILVTGSALPDIPVSHRPVFFIKPLNVVLPPVARRNLQVLFPSGKLSVQNLTDLSALMLVGPLDLVEQAQEAIDFFDQPIMSSKNSAEYRPLFLKAAELALGLRKVLGVEGYAVTMAPVPGPLMLLPFPEQNRIIIFANDKKVLKHALDWAENLDSDHRTGISDDFFVYEAVNMPAEHIANVVSALENAGNAQTTSSSSRQTGGQSQEGQSGRQSSGNTINSYMSGKLVVDGSRNVIFFKGSGKEWGRLRELIQKVDQPVPMVLIDVLLVELTLSEGENSGIEGVFKGTVGDGYNLRGGTLGGLSLGGNGLSLVMDSAGETRAVLNAFYQNDKASIRSSPKLLVKSGETASIEVGNEIPILSSNAQSLDALNAPVLQTVKYRKTGVLLKINPIVQAGGLVDLVISQELSEQQAIGAAGSPVILQRSLNTALSIKDGGSILLGGLISDNQIDGRTGLPIVSRVPLLGKLFSVDSKSSGRTELLMLVSTFVLNSNDAAVEVTRSMKERFLTEKED
ncbi:MAG: type II secretion system protein GspD [Candidatus Azotimanducaceae bacterium]